MKRHDGKRGFRPDAAVTKNDSEYNGNEKEIASLRTSLDRLRQEYDDCVRSQRKHEAGRERAACGSPGPEHDGQLRGMHAGLRLELPQGPIRGPIRGRVH